MKRSIVFLFLSSLLISCQQQQSGTDVVKTDAAQQVEKATLKVSHAKFFKVDYIDDMKVVEIINPDDTSQILIRYYLAEDKNKLADNIQNGEFIKIPLNRIAITTSTQAAYLNSLEEIDKIKGISEPKYFSNKAIKELVTKGEIKDIGPSANINHEVLINLNTNVFFISLFKNNGSQKIKELGLQPCLDLAYLEHTPLGRAEWVKFFALFFNKEQQADSIFSAIERHYNTTKQLTKKISPKPTIISGKKFGQLWHVPGGRSYMAEFFKDAGAKYLWADDNTTGSIPLDFESVYAKGAGADFWCFKKMFQGKYSMSELAAEFEPYKDFEAFEKKQVIYCNVANKPYYEDGVMEPHLILSDLVKLMHPELLPDYATKYFEFLSNNE